MNKYIFDDSSLMHYGVKGMKWGERKDRTPIRTKIHASRDAKESARAKMFYGEGAGNRRKLIKNKVAERSKDPKYKAAYEKALSKQKMDKHADAAKRERYLRDAKSSAGRTARGLVNSALGNIGRASAASAFIYLTAKYTGLDKKAYSAVKKYGAKAVDAAKFAYNKYQFKKFVRNI